MNRWALIGSCNRLVIWQSGIVSSGARLFLIRCLRIILKRRLHSKFITGRKATIDLSAKVGGGGMWLAHYLDKASGTNWCSSFPATWYSLMSLSCKYIFHLNTLPVNVTLMLVRFIWSVFKMKYLLSNRSSNSLSFSLADQFNCDPTSDLLKNHMYR